MNEFDYDVALSFAGEDRASARQVAAILQAADVRVFFDELEATRLWGKDLAVEFERIYGHAARFVVPFVSHHYATKAWPTHEFQSALATAVENQGERILPVRLDATALPGLRGTIGYLDGQQLMPEEIATAILEKLGRQAEVRAAGVRPRETRLPRVVPADFNPYAEAERAVATLRADLSRRASGLEPRGFGVHAQERNGRFMLRIMHSGRTIYSLDFWIGGDWGDNTICFSTGAGGHVSPGSTNAHGTIEWDRERGLPVVKMLNLSLLPEIGREYRLTPEELAEAIWNELCNRLERGPT